MKGLIRFSILAGSVALISSNAWAGDGALGATSTATSTITVTTTEMAQITNVGDITVNPYVPSSGIDQNDDVCVYSNDSTATKYLVTATGDGAGSPAAFTITDGTHTIAYTVKWNGATGPGTNSLTTGVQFATAFTGTNTYPCVTNNANFRIQMTNNNIMSVPAGTYSGVLTLDIVPDPA